MGSRPAPATDRHPPDGAVTAIAGAAMLYRCLNDSEWTMLEVSGGCCEVTGYAPETIVGNHSRSYATLIVPDDRIEVSAAVQEALTDRRPFQISYRIRHADGSIRRVWEQGWGRFDADGRPSTIEGVIVGPKPA